MEGGGGTKKTCSALCFGQEFSFQCIPSFNKETVNSIEKKSRIMKVYFNNSINVAMFTNYETIKQLLRKQYCNYSGQAN